MAAKNKNTNRVGAAIAFGVVSVALLFQTYQLNRIASDNVDLKHKLDSVSSDRQFLQDTFVKLLEQAPICKREIDT